MRISVNTLDLKSPSFSPANYAIAARRIAQRSGKIGVLVHPGYAEHSVFNSRMEHQLYRVTGFSGSFSDYLSYQDATNQWLAAEKRAVFVIHDTEYRLPERQLDRMEASGSLLIDVDSLEQGSPRPKLESDHGKFFPFRWQSLRRIIQELGGKYLVFAGELFSQSTPLSNHAAIFSPLQRNGHKLLFKPSANFFCLDAAMFGLLGLRDQGLAGQIYYPATFPGLISPLSGKRMVFEGAYDQ